MIFSLAWFLFELHGKVSVFDELVLEMVVCLCGVMCGKTFHVLTSLLPWAEQLH